MFILDLNKQSEENIYKTLRQHFFHYKQYPMFFNSEIKIDESFINRIIANEWYLSCSYYLVIPSINSGVLLNLVNLTDILTGVVINFKEDRIVDSELKTLLRYCQENNLDIKFINNKNLALENYNLLKEYEISLEGEQYEV